MIELHDSDFEPIDDFPFLWRWTEENHTLFLPQELEAIRPLKADLAQKLHHEMLKVDRPNGLNRNVTEDLRVIESNDENDDEIRNWLINLPVHETEQVILSWASDTAIMTTWKLFREKWSDFWYPSSDDLTVTNCSMSWVLAVYHYGRFEWGKWSNGYAERYGQSSFSGKSSASEKAWCESFAKDVVRKLTTST